MGFFILYIKKDLHFIPDMMMVIIMKYDEMINLAIMMIWICFFFQIEGSE